MTLSGEDIPSDFIIGTATAAYQIEGFTTTGGRGRSIWDDLTEKPGAIIDGRTGDPADEHYERYLEDVGIMSDLGLDAYRFSISWTRIQPDGTGPANAEGLAYYRRLAEALLAQGITPYATLYHWDLPSALEDQGGWLNRETADRFADYTRVVVEGLGDLISHWITLNEPWCSAFLGYASGVHAPGKQLGSSAAHAAHHLLLGHGRAVDVIRDANPKATVGIALNLYSVRPSTDTVADIDSARRIDGLHNRLFLDPVLRGNYPADVLHDLGEERWFAANPSTDVAEIAVPIDFLGINYYSRHTTTASTPPAAGASSYPGSEFVSMVDTGAPKTLMGWEIHPDGLLDVVRMAHDLNPRLPLYITENGAAYEDSLLDSGEIADQERLDYIEKHLTACLEAASEGLPLRGYFAWSLMDNFEWSWGYTRRFGLVHVNYDTQERTIKRSGHWLADILKARPTAFS